VEKCNTTAFEMAYSMIPPEEERTVFTYQREMQSRERHFQN